MHRAATEISLKPKLLAVSVAACFALTAAPLRANPTGPTVVHGSVGFSGLGTSALSITNQAGGNAIINWNGFSIGVNELTRFQQFANLAVLNRVTGAEMSSILGALQSDGRVFLINPNGIVFGAAARIDTAGLVASSLALSDQDFLNGRLRFTEVPGAGAVVNNGIIETAAGGRVYLVAPSVENNGLITSPQGAIVLAAGKEVELVDPASPFVTVQVAASEQAVNVGSLVAEGGQIGMFGALVRNAGVVQAGGAVAGPGGEIRLVAAKDLEVGGTVSANGTSGGKVLLQAEGGTNLVSGTVEAKGSSGNGGAVSALGVRVGVVGHGVIDASGDAGGGTVLVGGDYQGANGAVQNAERTYIGTDGVIRADAMTVGDGGRVVVWADGDTRFYGNISARGGALGGNGGFVETSGKQALEALGTVNAGASNGEGGIWLLDPTNISISPSVGLPDNGNIEFDGLLLFTDLPGANVTVGEGSIEAALAYGVGLVDLQATNDITLNGNITIDQPGALTLRAGNDIRFNSFNLTTNGDLTLVAAAPGGAVVTGAITAVPGGGNIATNNGDFTASARSISLGSISTDGAGSGGGVVSLNASAGNIQTGAIATDGGFVSMSAYGSATVTGAINTSGDATGGASNGSVFINANGNITTQSITTRSLHPDNGVGGDVFLDTETGSIVVNGSIDTRGANGVDVGQSQYYAGTEAGNVGLSRGASDGFVGNAITINGSILAMGGSGVAAVGGFSGNASGANGGEVEIGDLCDGFCGPVYGSVSITGGINTAGGNGGSNTDPFFSVSGGSGGDARIEAHGSIGIGSIVTRGGSGGAGANGAYGQNFGGFGGTIDIVSGGAVSVSSIDTSGGHGGAGGGYGGEANGGDGGWAGWIDIQGASVSLGSVVARGGNGGPGGTLGEYYGATGGDGGYGGELDLWASGGNLSVGSVDTRGGVGGNGGVTGDFAVGASAAFGGDGGEGGDVFASASGSTTIGPILANGGAGGAGGIAPGDSEFSVDGNARGGQGGDGGSTISINAGSFITVASISASGGAGGQGGTAQLAGGGGGGDGANFIVLSSSTGVAVGPIVARGGNGGTGGTALDPVNSETSSSGGDGGRGTGILVSTAGNIASGMIDVSGGTGGNGGPVGADTDSGGSGGDGGNVGYYGMAINIAGPVLARGGNGGAMINASLEPCGECTPNGGSGGSGGRVNVEGEGIVQINVGGALGAVAIDVSGGSGGAGNPASSPAGFGGGGGDGGMANVVAAPDMTLFGSVLASGGAGGAGGAGGGIGGNGGAAGSLFFNASSVPGTQTGDGIIFVLAGSSPFIGQSQVLGGAAGLGSGGNGTPGVASDFLKNSNYFGTIVILDPLSIPEINQAVQQTADDGATSFVGGEKEEEEEDKSQKELGSCKG